MRFSVRNSCVFGFLLLLFVIVPLLQSQSTQSSILGTARDTSGAAIPSVRIVITDTGKEIRQTMSQMQTAISRRRPCCPGNTNSKRVKMASRQNWSKIWN